MTHYSRFYPLAFVALVAFAVAAWFLFLRPEPQPADPDAADSSTDTPVPDPRETFPTIFRNVKPSVHYLGDDSKCAACHRKLTQSYHEHPMGRSAGFVGKAVSIERLEASAHPSFDSGPFTLRVDRANDGFLHHMTTANAAGEYTTTARLAIGSGTRGRSYLALESGAVWQSPISWFSAVGRWDLSPGFDLSTGGRRPIPANCLFCHVDRVEPVAGSTNRYHEPVLKGQPSIGCERCHGPGELHVAERTADPRPPAEPDTSIVNPKHLSAELQASICAQCHLQGQARVVRRDRNLFEFRPGLPLGEILTVFVRHPALADLQKSVGQFEQLERSRCVSPANEKLTCTTCHDPHTAPDEKHKLDFYRTRCIQCHTPERCTADAAQRKQKNDACTACHMPRQDSSNIAHASVTDHRILRTPPAPSRPPSLAPDVLSPLVAFGPPRADQERDLGIALTELAASSPANRRQFGTMATDRLTRSLKTRPRDVDAWLALSLARVAENEIDEARSAVDRASALAPNSDAALAAIAEAAIAQQKFNDAIAAATKLIERNPTAIDPLIMRAVARVEVKDWPGADADCRQALAIHPLHAQARLVQAVCRHRLGDAPAGRKEAETAAELAGPQKRDAFLAWYAEQTR